MKGNTSLVISSKQQCRYVTLGYYRNVKEQFPTAIHLWNVCFNEVNAEPELSPYSIWIYRSNSESTTWDKDKPSRWRDYSHYMIKGHCTANHSLSRLWPRLTHRFLCSLHYSRRCLCCKWRTNVFTQLEYAVIPAKNVNIELIMQSALSLLIVLSKMETW